MHSSGSRNVVTATIIHRPNSTHTTHNGTYIVTIASDATTARMHNITVNGKANRHVTQTSKQSVVAIAHSTVGCASRQLTRQVGV